MPHVNQASLYTGEASNANTDLTPQFLFACMSHSHLEKYAPNFSCKDNT
jgi:hypothetical protein